MNTKYNVLKLIGCFLGQDEWAKIQKSLILVKPSEWIATYLSMGSCAGVYEDLLIDTYIRFRPSPTVSRNDAFWKSNLHRAKRIERLTTDLIGRYHPKLAFGSYCSYIYHGIPHRVCLSKRIPTITFGGGQDFYRFHDPRSGAPSHVSDYTRYEYPPSKPIDQRISHLAEQSLMNRVSGKIDGSVPYMREERSQILVDDSVKIFGERVIFLHDFYDSSHIYRWTIFQDHYQWAIETIEHLLANNSKVFIKPHPNAIEESKQVVNELMAKLGSEQQICWLDSHLTNASLFQAKPSLVITVYGSVGPEAAYYGIPVVYAGDHPAINFPIGATPRSKSHYFQLIDNPSEVPVGTRDAAISFVAQHYNSLFTREHQSLFAFLGVSWDEIERNPSLLQTPQVSDFLKSNCSLLLDKLGIKQLSP